MATENAYIHFETFDILHAFLPLIIAKLSTLKQVRFLLDHPVLCIEKSNPIDIIVTIKMSNLNQSE